MSPRTLLPGQRHGWQSPTDHTSLFAVSWKTLAEFKQSLGKSVPDWLWRTASRVLLLLPPLLLARGYCFHCRLLSVSIFQKTNLFYSYFLKIDE